MVGLGIRGWRWVSLGICKVGRVGSESNHAPCILRDAARRSSHVPCCLNSKCICAHMCTHGRAGLKERCVQVYCWSVAILRN